MLTKGRANVNVSLMSKEQPQTSLNSLYGFPIDTSGDMYRGLPTFRVRWKHGIIASRRWRRREVDPDDAVETKDDNESDDSFDVIVVVPELVADVFGMTRAISKSRTLIHPSLVSPTLSGFKSRWMIFRLCRNVIASAKSIMSSKRNNQNCCNSSLSCWMTTGVGVSSMLSGASVFTGNAADREGDKDCFSDFRSFRPFLPKILEKNRPGPFLSLPFKRREDDDDDMADRDDALLVSADVAAVDAAPVFVFFGVTIR
mmetsp:Transcript_31886/g.77441  ORF Transcript_31886/g.77441 Transcript_31886/m.77441 type:complete len:257 (+) Transcript_31886:625-1395(+)